MSIFSVSLLETHTYASFPNLEQERLETPCGLPPRLLRPSVGAEARTCALLPNLPGKEKNAI